MPDFTKCRVCNSDLSIKWRKESSFISTKTLLVNYLDFIKQERNRERVIILDIFCIRCFIKYSNNLLIGKRYGNSILDELTISDKPSNRNIF